MLGPSAHTDTFTRDNLPPAGMQPDFLLDSFSYPERLNAAVELTQIVDTAKIEFALCDTRIIQDLLTCAASSRFLRAVVGFDGTANHESELDRIALDKPVRFQAVETGRDDVALMAFTSGTTGK